MTLNMTTFDNENEARSGFNNACALPHAVQAGTRESGAAEEAEKSWSDSRSGGKRTDP